MFFLILHSKDWHFGAWWVIDNIEWYIGSQLGTKIIYMDDFISRGDLKRDPSKQKTFFIFLFYYMNVMDVLT